MILQKTPPVKPKKSTIKKSTGGKVALTVTTYMGIREWGCTNYVLVRKHNIGADL